MLPTALFPSPASRLVRAALGALAIAAGCAATLRASGIEPTVTVLRDRGWAPGDCVRDGAATMQVFLCAAALQHDGGPAGIVCVGNCHGILQPGAESALAQVACMGLPVVRTALHGVALPNDLDPLIDAGPLSEAEASQILADCLKRYGAPPAMADPFHPTSRERSALRSKLALYRRAFSAAAGAAVRPAMQ